MDLTRFCVEFQLDPSVQFGIGGIFEPELFHATEQYLELEFQLDLHESLKVVEVETRQAEDGTAKLYTDQESLTDLPSTDSPSPNPQLLVIQKTITTPPPKPKIEYQSSGWTCINSPYIKPENLTPVKTRNQKEQEFLAKVDMTTPSKTRIAVVI